MLQSYTVSGYPACGKDTAFTYLKNKLSNPKIFQISQILKEALVRMNIEQTRDNYVALCSELFSTFGDSIFATITKHFLETLKNGDIFLTEGVRKGSLIDTIMEYTQARVIFIEVSSRIRYERAVLRSEKAEGSLSYDEFLTQDALHTEIELPYVRTRATHIINNDGGYEALYSQLDMILRTPFL